MVKNMQPCRINGLHSGEVVGNHGSWGATNIAQTLSARYLTESTPERRVLADSRRLRSRRSPEFRGVKPGRTRILRSSVLGTPLFNR